MTVVPLLPAAEAVLVAWAKQDAPLVAIQGTRVSTKLSGVLPATRVALVGSDPINADQWGVPELQIEAWAASDVDASRLARTWVQRLYWCRGPYAGAHVSGHELTSGPYWAPDDPQLSSNARYILTAQLVISAL